MRMKGFKTENDPLTSTFRVVPRNQNKQKLTSVKASMIAQQFFSVLSFRYAERIHLEKLPRRNEGSFREKMSLHRLRSA